MTDAEKLELIFSQGWQWFRTADGQEFYRMLSSSKCYTGEELLAEIKSFISGDRQRGGKHER